MPKKYAFECLYFSFFLGRAVCSVGENNGTQDNVPGLSEFGKVCIINLKSTQILIKKNFIIKIHSFVAIVF